MNSTPSHVTAVAYQVRSSSGRQLIQHDDRERAESSARWFGQVHGIQAYVTFVELIDGVWTAPED